MSVINHLDRYMKEPGANEELLSLIIGSLDDWDEKMQLACGEAILGPLQHGQVSMINQQRILSLSVEISTNFDCENEKLIDAWIEVFANVVGRVELHYLEQVAIKVIQELPSLKNPLPKR